MSNHYKIKKASHYEKNYIITNSFINLMFYLFGWTNNIAF